MAVVCATMASSLYSMSGSVQMILCNVRQVYLYMFGYGAALVCMARRVQTAVPRSLVDRNAGREGDTAYPYPRRSIIIVSESHDSVCGQFCDSLFFLTADFYDHHIHYRQSRTRDSQRPLAARTPRSTETRPRLHDRPPSRQAQTQRESMRLVSYSETVLRHEVTD